MTWPGAPRDFTGEKFIETKLLTAFGYRIVISKNLPSNQKFWL